MGKKLPSDVIDDAIKLKLNSISSYDVSRLLGVSDTWVDKIWQLYRCVRDEKYDKVAESINLRYAGVHTVEHIFKKCRKAIPENVQTAIDRKTKKPEPKEQKQLVEKDIADYEQEKADGYFHNYGSPVVARLNVIINRLDRLIELWEK